MKTIIGVDPGPTTGIVELVWDDDGRLDPESIVQCNALVAPSIVSLLVNGGVNPVVLAIEKFVDGRRSGRGNAPHATRITRNMIVALSEQYDELSFMSVALRSAAEVKPWATDERLDRAGLYAPTKGMTHARDAARHALFAAVKLGAPDPLSHRAVKV